MSLPARFRRARIGLVGCGDVGARILTQHPGGSGPRIIPIGRRSGWNLDVAADRQRVSRLLTHWIVLVPPSDAHPSQDTRSRLLAASARQSRQVGSIGAAAIRRPRGVYISTTGVYGDHQGAVVRETSACRTTLPRSLWRLHAERIWRSLGFHRLRVPCITGPDRLPFERIATAAPALVPQDDVYTNHIDANDLARICWVALWRGRPGRATNTVMEGDLKMGDYLDAVALAAGLPRVPRISRAELDEAVRSGRVSPMMASFMLDSRRVRSSRLEADLRMTLQTPCLEALLKKTLG